MTMQADRKRPPRRRRAHRRDRRRRGKAGIFDAEQALRADQQHHRHHQIDQEQRQAREIGLAERVRLPDQQAADERAAQAAHAADHDDDESRDQDLGVHAGIKPDHRRSRHAAERRERHAGAENAGEQRRNVGAETRRHGGIVDAGAHHGAEPAALQKQPQQQRQAPSRARSETAGRSENTPTPIWITSCRLPGAGRLRIVRPHTDCTKSKNTKVKPNVSSTWSMWPRR